MAAWSSRPTSGGGCGANLRGVKRRSLWGECHVFCHSCEVWLRRPRLVELCEPTRFGVRAGNQCRDSGLAGGFPWHGDASPWRPNQGAFHERHESAFYLLSGEEVELCTGRQLEHREIARPGDYLFIPVNVPHVAVNCGKSPAVFVGVRNEPTAQESVVMTPELDALVSWLPLGMGRVKSSNGLSLGTRHPGSASHQRLWDSIIAKSGRSGALSTAGLQSELLFRVTSGEVAKVGKSAGGRR